MKALNIEDVPLASANLLQQRRLLSPDQPHSLRLALVQQAAPDVLVERHSGRGVELRLKRGSFEKPLDQLLGLSVAVPDPLLELLDGFRQEAINGQNDET